MTSLQTQRSSAEPRARRTLPLRDQLRTAYARATGIEQMHGKQLDSMEALLRLLARVQRREGDQIHRTWRQLARGLGWAPETMTVDEVHKRFRGTLRNQLRYLETAGFLEGWEAIYEGRESTGILIRLPAGVAQLVQASGFRA